MHQAEHSPQRQHVCLQKQAAFCTKAQSTLWKRLLLGSLYNSLREVMRLRTSASVNFTTESYQWDLKSLHWVQRWHYFNRETRRLSTYQAHTGTWVLHLQLFPQPAQPTVSGEVSPLMHLSCATYDSIPVRWPFTALSAADTGEQQVTRHTEACSLLSPTARRGALGVLYISAVKQAWPLTLLITK